MLKVEKQDSNKKRINDLVDVKILQEILDAFTTTTGLMANIVDVDGVSIFPRKGIKKCSQFCRLIYDLEGGKSRCQAAYKRAGKQAALFGEPYIFRCPSGLVEWAAPIVLNEEHVGTIICGQVLMWEPEEFFWIELRKMNQSITDDFEELFKAVDELPVVTGNQVQASAYLLYVVANYIMKAGWESFQQSREFDRQRTLIHAEIEKQKEIELLEEKQSSLMSINEDEMLIQLTTNRKKAKIYFENMIASLRYDARNDPVLTQGKMTEFLVVLLRVITQMGFDTELFWKINARTIPLFYQTSSSDQMGVLASKAIDEYLEGLQQIEEQPQNPNISVLIEFVNENYSDNLTLDRIAEAASLSAGYAGRIFKEQMGNSIMDFVTQVRIEHSKKLLLNPHYQIQSIAEKVGYGDAGYFTKVFKKVEGFTPTQYRKIHKR